MSRPRITQPMRRAVADRYGVELGERKWIGCVYCAAPIEVTRDEPDDRVRFLDVRGRSTPELDHYFPLAFDGPHTAENLLPACLRCNRRKCANPAGALLEQTQSKRSGLLEQSHNPSDCNLRTATSVRDVTTPRVLSSPALSRLQGECETLLRELGPDWQTPLPENPTPDQEVAAWMRDARIVHAAAERLRERRRLVAFYRQRLRELEAA